MSARWIAVRAGAPIVAIWLAVAACGDPAAKLDLSSTAVFSEPSVSASAEATPVTPVATVPPSTATLAPAATTTPIPATLPRDPAPVTTPTGTTRSRSVTEDFDTLPQRPWYHPEPHGRTTLNGGILTLDAAADGGNEFILGHVPYPNDLIPAADAWETGVSNTRGWWVEVRMRVDPLTEEQCDSDTTRGPALTLWAADETYMLVRLGFSRSCVALVYSFNESITVPMDTATEFHTYRVSTRLRHVDVYIDGALAIQRDYGPIEQAVTGLVFGDMQSGYGPTRS